MRIQKNQRLGEFLLEGMSVRTCNAWEMDPSTAQIGRTIQEYSQSQWAKKIKHRKNPNVTYCVYTDYESDHTGFYTYFIGEEVTEASPSREDLSFIRVPAQSYMVLTNGPGPMPDICLEAWQKVWGMTPQDLGAERSYGVDFELYRGPVLGKDPTTMSLYIALEE